MPSHKNNKDYNLINKIGKGPTSNSSGGSTCDPNDQLLVSNENLTQRDCFGIFWCEEHSLLRELQCKKLGL